MALGVVVTTRESAPSRGAASDTGKWFVLGRSDAGPVDKATRVNSIADARLVVGARDSNNALLYDSLDTFFQEGGETAYIGRVTGPGAVAASADLEDASAETVLHVEANGPGTWANSWSLEVTASGTQFSIGVKNEDGTVVESTGMVDSVDDAVAWGAGATFVRITKEGATSALDPKAAASVSLTGGDSDLDAITPDDFASALVQFPSNLGPGQLSALGQSDEDLYAALWNHAKANNRYVIADTPNTTDVDELTAVAGTLPEDELATYGMAFGPWYVVPGGGGSGATRTVPASAVICGLIARVDATGNPNQAAAGRSWPVSYANEMVIDFSDEDREALLGLGINTGKFDLGLLVNYGFETPSDITVDPIFWQGNAARLRMALVALAQAAGAPYVFRNLDAQGKLAAGLKGDLSGDLSSLYHAGALYGETPAQAYEVIVSSRVNTVNSVAKGELIVEVEYVPSLHAKVVRIVLVAIPVNA
jgi:phage tail sheath protein FI